MRLTREEREARYWAHEDRHHERPSIMSEHTPGPWTATACDDFYQIQGRGAYVAEVFNSHEANARLIEAAPDMLEALQDILESAFIDIDDGKWALRALSEIRPIASRAIRKAKGGVEEHGRTQRRNA